MSFDGALCKLYEAYSQARLVHTAAARVAPCRVTFHTSLRKVLHGKFQIAYYRIIFSIGPAMLYLQ